MRLLRPGIVSVTTAVLALSACKTSSNGTATLKDVSAVAAADTPVKTAFRAALSYLEKTQIKDPDKLSDGIRLQGEWPSYVRGSVLDDKQVSAIYDSNAFIPMFVIYPTLFLDDSALPDAARRIRDMKKRVLPLLKKWYVDQKGEANFWPVIDGFHGPPQIFEAIPSSRVLGPAFDIANDADDTSVFYMTALKLQNEFPDWAQAQGLTLNHDFGAFLSRWRDHNRVRADKREAEWKPDATGAFMTWLDDEEKVGNRLPINFYLPNNVDCTVMGNAMYALGVNEKLTGTSKSVAGYDESCTLARLIIEKRFYPECGFYYPPEWLFPYVLGRAFADGGATCLADSDQGGKPATETIIDRIIKDQVASGAQAGAWLDNGKFANLPADVNAKEPEFQGSSEVYSTALNIVTLYNLRANTRPEAAKAIENGINFLIAHSVSENGMTFWQGGVFFSSSIKEVARWKSRPYTTAVVLEALSKYLRDPAHGGAGLDGRWQLTPADVPQDWL